MECSSSCDSEGDFFDYLARSLDAIEAEAPIAFRAMCGALGERALEIEADGRVMGLGVRAGRVVLADTPPAPAVRIRVSRPVVLRLIEGECTIVEAALAGDLFLRGAAEDLAAFGEALTAFVHGAVRSVTAPLLLRSYKGPHDSGRGPTRAVEASPQENPHNAR